MSDNRELLELAAKAAGLELDYSIRNDGAAFYHTGRNALALADGGWFSSLEDDGDAFRLMAKLGLQASVQADFQAECIDMNEKACCVEQCQNATEAEAQRCLRLVITRAAAEIGRQMQPHPSRVRAFGEQS